MYELNEPTEESSTPRGKVKMRISGHAVCPGCGELVKRGAVMCVQCGFNLKKGAYVSTDIEGVMNESVIPNAHGGGGFKTHIPPARKVRDDTAQIFREDWD